MNGSFHQHPSIRDPPSSSHPSPKERIGSILHHHPSASNLIQDETMMERNSNHRRNSNNANNSLSHQPYQSAGLSSSPDDDNRTEATSNVSVSTTAGATPVALPDPYHDNNNNHRTPSVGSSGSGRSHPSHDPAESLSSSLNTPPVMPSRSVSLTTGVFEPSTADIDMDHDDFSDAEEGDVTAPLITRTDTNPTDTSLLDDIQWVDEDDDDSVGEDYASAEDIPFFVDEDEEEESPAQNMPANSDLHSSSSAVILDDDSSNVSDDNSGTAALTAELAKAEDVMQEQQQKRDSTTLLEDYHQDLARENQHLQDHSSLPRASWGGGTDEDDYDNGAREPPEGGVVVSQDRTYESVEYKKVQGRLLLKAETIQFIPEGEDEAAATVPWKDVIKVQISPASYAVPMMRVKTSSNKSGGDGSVATNYMFRLKDQKMADALRDDIRDYPVPMEDKLAAKDALRASMASRNNRNDPDKRASFWADVERDLLRSSAVSAASVQPYARDKAMPLLQETDNDQSATETDALLSSTLMAGDSLTDHGNSNTKDDSTDGDDVNNSTWDDEEGEEGDADWESVKHASSGSNGDGVEKKESDLEAGAIGIETAQEKALREYNEKVARDTEASIERRLFNCFLITCFVSAIVFVVIGGVSGYFIGKNQGSNGGSSSDKDIVTPSVTPVPTVMVTPQPSASEISQTTAAPTTSTPTTLEPTFTPSAYPTIDITNRTLQPTLRGLPPRPQPTTLSPTAETQDTPAPTIVPTESVETTLPSAVTTLPTADLMVVTVLPTSVPSSTQDTLFPTADSETMAASNETMTQSPTGSPTVSSALLTLIRERSSDNGTAVDVQGSPQNEAYRWMTVDDAAFSERLTEEKQLQRYALASFYYSTGGEGVWGESVATRQEASGASWMTLGLDDCEWDFIVCSENQEIVALEMLEPAAPDLSGTLAKEIGLLTSLTQFVIATNAERSITRLASDANLTDAENSVRQGGNGGNMIRGQLPSEVGLLKQLQTFTITDQGLSGGMPYDVGDMSSLEYFDVTNNKFRGPVPLTFGRISQLRELRLGFNNFQTEFNPELFNQENGMSQSLQFFDVQNNNIRGTIPSEIGLLTSITTGLFLQRNRFTGLLPSELGLLTQMVTFRVTGNALGGEVPESFGSWSEIQEFRINANGFTGEVPGELCRLFVLRGTESYADCEEITCDCCTFCCTTGQCVEQ